MNKNTLDQYGWFVVVIIILAIIITLATPFGNAIKNSITGAVTDFNDTAINALDGIVADAEFSGSSSTPGSASGEEDAGSFMPDPDPAHETPEYGDEIIIGDYTYEYVSSFQTFESGWVVGPVTDSTKTEYGPICETIYGEPVIGMSLTFDECENIKSIPDIPKTVRVLEHAFPSCDSIDGVVVIPETVVECSTTLANMGANVPIEVPATSYAFYAPVADKYYLDLKMSNKKVYSWSGEAFEPNHASPYNGEQIIIGNFLYCYNYVPDGMVWEPYTNIEGCISGWTVMPLDLFGAYSTDEICSSIYGKPVVTGAWLYAGNYDVVTIPDFLTAILGDPFHSTKIGTLNIPASVSYINCFDYDSAIETINFEANKAPEGFIEPRVADVNYGVKF